MPTIKQRNIGFAEMVRDILSELDRLAAENAALRAQLKQWGAVQTDQDVMQWRGIGDNPDAALRADAGRWRWFRSKVRGRRTDDGQEFVLWDINPTGDIMRGSIAGHLDNAIDAARAKGG